MKTSPPDLRLGKLLVPVDFSDCSRWAVEFAATLAKRFNSEVVLVHVMEPCLGTGDFLLDLARIRANSEEIAHKQLEEWAQEFQLKPEIVIRIGAPAHEILSVATTIKAAAIIISSHGRNAVGRFFIGSVMERVVRHATCPVIVLPWKEPPLTTQKKTNSAGSSRGYKRRSTKAIWRKYEQST